MPIRHSIPREWFAVCSIKIAETRFQASVCGKSEVIRWDCHRFRRLHQAGNARGRAFKLRGKDVVLPQFGTGRCLRLSTLPRVSSAIPADDISRHWDMIPAGFWTTTSKGLRRWGLQRSASVSPGFGMGFAFCCLR